MMHIAFCTDTNYVMPTGVAMISICENNKEERITFHLVITDEGTAPDEVEKKVQPLLDIVSKYNKEVQKYSLKKDLLSDFECLGGGYISVTAFARIFLPELLSEDIAKVLYFDCDIVCNGPLRELWNFDLSDSPIGGVFDCGGNMPTCRARVGTPLCDPYINSGILYLNLELWRQNNYSRQVANCAIERRFEYLDQDALNFIFHGNIKILPIKYNVQSQYLFTDESHWCVEYQYLDEIREAIKTPSIVHFSTINKPWKDTYCPKREIWEKYESLSIWKDQGRSHVDSWFNRTHLYYDIETIYWTDCTLFAKEAYSYLRFFQVAVLFKNKTKIVGFISSILNFIALLLEKTYKFKMRNR